jgi:5-methyltetrahydropteroyltriglutamate--homocysteine methyltransferase
VSQRPLSTTVVGSYPQPDWLIDREALGSHSVPRVRVCAAWRIPEPYLREAQDDAIRNMERAGIDTITDGEIRRESYSSRFATALDGVDAEHPATIHTSGGDARTVPRIVGPVRWRALQAAGADVIQLDEPWLRNDPDTARRIAVAAIDRALDGLTVTTIVLGSAPRSPTCPPNGSSPPPIAG